MAKVDRIKELLEFRISRGDYALTPFPSEVRLAEEIGASRTTVRGATISLIEKGLLRRELSGRITVPREPSASRPLHVGFLLPAMSTDTVQWGRQAEVLVHSHGGIVRTVEFFHWNDPVLLDAIENFDGIFMVPPAETLPLDLAGKLRAAKARLLLLGDYQAVGLHCANLASPSHVGGLLDHLSTLGHRRIAAFNTQPLVNVIERRLRQWDLWLTEHGCTGEMVNEPEPSYGFPLERAYAVAKERLASGVGFGGTAVLCITMPAALGLMRAMYEFGLEAGRDISICCAFDEGTARFLCPPLTSVQMTNPDSLLRACVNWMGGGLWEGPLLRPMPEGEIFKGESTGPAPQMPAPYHKGREITIDFMPAHPPHRSVRRALKRVSTSKQAEDLLQYR